ncbi:MAG: SDR family oxidoreductase [Burkholderiales bacterium]|nr:SDR family oxidoreductase [Burkholderiales bacterium]
MNKTIVLTGASGFVGGAIARALLRQGEHLVCPSRQPLSWQAEQMRNPPMTELAPDSDWSDCLRAAEIVIHCAARVHVMQEAALDPLAEFRRVNVAATLNLARQAAAAGVRQFVFLSSVKVNGEATLPGQPFTENSPPQPQDAYGVSKLEAESALLALGRETGMAITIVRPPLVYGPGVKANFLSMLRWVKKGLQLPLASIHNRRSFVYLENLVSLVLCCLRHAQAGQQVFLVSDDCDVATPDLLRGCAAALGLRARLLPCPPALLYGLARLAGRPAAAGRLCQSLQVDIAKARTVLGWVPPYTLEQGLRATTSTLK